jgi:hypothetical protein
MQGTGNPVYCSRSLKGLEMILLHAAVNVSGKESNSRVGYASGFHNYGFTEAGIK